MVNGSVRRSDPDFFFLFVKIDSGRLSQTPCEIDLSGLRYGKARVDETNGNLIRATGSDLILQFLILLYLPRY